MLTTNIRNIFHVKLFKVSRAYVTKSKSWPARAEIQEFSQNLANKDIETDGRGMKFKAKYF